MSTSCKKQDLREVIPYANQMGTIEFVVESVLREWKVIAFTLWMMVHSLWTFLLLIRISYNIMHNVTTNEFLNKDKYVRDGRTPTNVWDKGVSKNVLSTCGCARDEDWKQLNFDSLF